MNNLTLEKKNGVFVVDSREVAEITNVRHSDLLEKIANYIKHLTNGKFRSLDFFIPNDYVDRKGESRLRYLITKKGCDMVANKMTGEKGVLFTAAYVTKFEEMESQVRVLSPEEQLKASMKMTLETSEEIGIVKKKVVGLEERFDNELTLKHGQATTIQHAVKVRVESLWEDGLRGTLESKHQMYMRIHSQLKRAFQAPTYREIKRIDYNDAMAWIKAWRPL